MGRRGHIGRGAINCLETLLMHSKCDISFCEKWPLAKMYVTKLYHRCEGKSCKFCEWSAHNPIDIGWERLFKDNPWDNSSDNSNAATYQLIQRWMKSRSVFIVDEEILTVMDSIVEEHKCTDDCKTVVENSYSGINKVDCKGMDKMGN